MVIPPFFQRGTGPLVSVLIPTRNRLDCKLDDVVDSCLILAKDPAQVEVLIKVDEDDSTSSERVDRLSAKYPGRIKKVILPCGRGYLDIARYMNELAVQASGDWLFLLGDNTCVLTKNWDVRVLQAVPLNPWLGMQDVCMLTPTMHAFSFLRRRTADLMGYVTPIFAWDLWLLAVMLGIECSFGVAIDVAHSRASPIPFEEQRRRLAASADIFSTQMRRLMNTQSERLLERLESIEHRTVWSSAPKTSGWYIWKSVKDNLTMAMYVDVDHKQFVSLSGVSPFAEEALWTPAV